MRKILCFLLTISFLICVTGCTPAWKGSYNKETLESKEWVHIGFNHFIIEEEVEIRLNFDNGKYTWYSTYKNTKTGKSGIKENTKGSYSINGTSIVLDGSTTLTFDRDEYDMVILKWGDRYFEQTYKG